MTPHHASWGNNNNKGNDFDRCFEVRSQLRLTVVFFVLRLVSNHKLQNPNPFIISDESYIDLAPKLQYWRTNRSAVSLEPVERAYQQGQFSVQGSSPLTLPRTRDGIWLRVLLSPPDAEKHPKKLAVRRTFYEKFQIFAPTLTGYQRTSIGYDHFENGASPKANHNQIDITVVPSEQRPVYIYVEDSLTIRVALEIWSPEVFGQHDTRMIIFMTTIASIILALALYNLSLYAILRDATYLHYVAYMGTLCAFLMTLETATYHIPWLSWSSWGTQEMVIFACLAAATTAHFNQSFVNLAHHTPQLNKIISGCKLVLLSIAAVCLLNIRSLDTLVTGLHNWVELVLAPLMVVASIIALRQGSRQARFFSGGVDIFNRRHLYFSS